jgi:hypothetical protein
MDEIISRTMVSNLITMSACAEHDPRQKIGAPYTMPDEDTRRLRAELILEEARETIEALGFKIIEVIDPSGPGRTEPMIIVKGQGKPAKLEDVIDGCADLNYVLTGTLATCGVYDNPHFFHVNLANESKIPPDGKPIFNPSGKFLKPPGWVPPNHILVQVHMQEAFNRTLREMAEIHFGAWLLNQQKRRS